ncbi:hypothetical protein BH10ACT11_BH10ACT11_10720 [soil metagenome]
MLRPHGGLALIWNISPWESQRTTFTHSEQLPRAAIGDILLSRSYVAALGERSREALFADIGRHLERAGAPVAGGEVTLDYATELYLTRRG